TTEEELDWYGEILINGTYKLDGADVDAEEYKGYMALFLVCVDQ
nr:hypothetical protein [Tanacetum cinerariifolium]